MTRAPWRGRIVRAAGLLAAGLAHALTFAPGPLPDWSLAAVQILALACLAGASTRAARPRSAFAMGWLFGFATYALGFYWIFISLHTYGYMAAPLAAAGVIALAAFLALYPALACGLARWLCPAATPGPIGSAQRASIRGHAVAAALVWAAAWAACEWLRGVVLSGFPWLNIGYAHVDSPLAGWAPVTGVLGMAFMAAFVAAALAASWPYGVPATSAGQQRTRPPPGAAFALAAALAIGVLGGWFLQSVRWSTPAGPPLAMRIVQANVDQSQKFDPALMENGIAQHMRLAMTGPRDGDAAGLILLPETVLPLFQDAIDPAVWQAWIGIAANRGATIAMGAPLHERGPGTPDRYSNSVIAFDARTPLQQLVSGRLPMRYAKRHLVPFGEYVPTGFRWFVDAMNIPLGDFDRGAKRQTPFAIGGQQIAFNICYEDLFGEELLPALWPNGQGPGATILANVSNLGWFGDSWALRQHLQIGRLRTLETARPMVTATNTGITAAIDEHGRIVAQLPSHQPGVLAVTVQGTTGYTLYARWGDKLPLTLAGVVLIGALLFRRRAKAAAFDSGLPRL